MEPQEEDKISLDDTLDSLKRNANASQLLLTETLQKLKHFQKKLHDETSETPSEKPLQPRTRMMKWLTDRGLHVESSFTDFFEALVEEHKKEHRLDLSKRAIQLNTAACVLFGYKDIDRWIPLYELFSKLPTLYYD